MSDIWNNNTQNEPLEENFLLQGITQRDNHKIYTLKGHEDTRVQLGCNVLWHEILHAMGYEHEEMSLCN